MESEMTGPSSAPLSRPAELAAAAPLPSSSGPPSGLAAALKVGPVAGTGRRRSSSGVGRALGVPCLDQAQHFNRAEQRAVLTGGGHWGGHRWFDAVLPVRCSAPKGCAACQGGGEGGKPLQHVMQDPMHRAGRTLRKQAALLRINRACCGACHGRHSAHLWRAAPTAQLRWRKWTWSASSSACA